jgi:hypothetical protein
MRERLSLASIALEMLAVSFGFGLNLVLPNAPSALSAVIAAAFGLSGIGLLAYIVLQPTAKTKPAIWVPEGAAIRRRSRLPSRSTVQTVGVLAIAPTVVLVLILIFGLGKHEDPCYAEIGSTGETGIYVPGFGAVLVPNLNVNNIQYKRDIRVTFARHSATTTSLGQLRAMLEPALERAVLD